MAPIRIRQSELFLYIRLLVAFGFISMGFNLGAGLIVSFVNPWFNALPSSYWWLNMSFNALRLIVFHSGAAWLLNRSEKRRQANDRFWMTIGLIFGPVAVAGYIVYQILRQYDLLLPESGANEKGLATEFIHLIRRDNE